MGQTKHGKAKKPTTDTVLKEIREHGLRYPGAHTKSPWPGHLDLAVNDKTFAFLSVEGQPFKISCKLPQSHAVALGLAFTKPTEYGLGKWGWVTAQLGEHETVPVDLFKDWIDESYRAIAPKKLVAQISVSADSTPRSDKPNAAKPNAADSRTKRTSTKR